MPQHVNPGLDATINPIVIDDSYREKKDIPIETVVELNEIVRKLKKHLQELKGVSFKVVADCESLSITLASNKPKSALELLKTHVAWLDEVSPMQLFDAYELGKMIEEAEKRVGEQK